MMIVDPYRFAAAGGGSDPDFASTVLLLSFDGADGSTTFTDESFVARGNATVFGNTQVDTAQSVFGGASGLFDGTGDFLNWGDNADFEFGAGAFTLECWYRTTTTTGTRAILAKSGAAGSRSWILRQNGTTLEWLVSLDGGLTISTIDVTGGTIAADTWYFIAFDYNTSKYRLYLGQAGGSTTMVGSSTTARTLHDNSSQLTVGALQTSGSSVSGWIDEVRITKGVARYANDSGFTVPTAAFPRS